jgi:chromosome segregation ATPase
LNAGIASDIKTAKTVINEDKTKLTNLNKLLKSKSIELSAARSQLAKVDANLKQLKNIRTSMQKQYNEFVNVSKQHKADGVSSSKAASLDKEIAQVKKQISEMDNLIAGLNSQRTAIKVG